MMNDSDSTEFDALRKDLLKRIAAVGLQELMTARQRQIFIMYHYQMMSITDIARELGVYKSTISRTLTRAEKKLAPLKRILSKI